MARKVDEAAHFVFVQLIVQEPGIYDKRHPDSARQIKIDLALERISHEMESYNRVQIQNMSAKALQITTTIWPMLCDTSQQLG
jgi:hypothetical protein